MYVEHPIRHFSRKEKSAALKCTAHEFSQKQTPQRCRLVPMFAAWELLLSDTPEQWFFFYRLFGWSLRVHASLGTNMWKVDSIGRAYGASDSPLISAIGKRKLGHRSKQEERFCDQYRPYISSTYHQQFREMKRKQLFRPGTYRALLHHHKLRKTNLHCCW